MTPKKIERICATCGATVLVYPSRAQCAHSFCNRECYVRWASVLRFGGVVGTPPFEDDAFWAKVFIRGDDECWEWTAATNGAYPQFNGRGGHCYVEEVMHGPIPKGIEVCHTCDNTLCVNPRHLFRGTRADNMRDMRLKRRAYHLPPRTALGEASPNHKLTEAQVQEIRRLRTDGHTQRSIGEMFGVDRGTIKDIEHGRTWGWLPSIGNTPWRLRTETR